MVVVVNLAEFRNRDTLAVLRALIERAIRGELFGLAVCALRPGHEDIYFTGMYLADPAKAVNAAARIKTRLTLQQDAAEAQDT
jgi:hypothetical protein